MPSLSFRIALPLLISGMLLFTAGCGGREKAPRAPQATSSATGTPAGSPVAPGAPVPSATATAGATPLAGSSIPVGAWTVIVDRYRARVTSPDGINIRSSPEIKPDNRTGSLPAGAAVEVEGRVNGQEAEPGHGTVWYFVGIAGNTPQFVYGAPGNLTPLNGSVTPQPVTPTGTAIPAASAPPPVPTLTPGTPRPAQ